MSASLRSRHTAPLLAAALLAATALVAPGMAQANVGVTSTSNGEPIGKPPQMPQRVLRVGVDIFANERITTGANDQAHVLFLDGSALTVGPNSDLVIDRFVYDPDKQTGSMAISATKGVFRLVGGRITKGDDAKMRVGFATIGIRGGITVIDAANPNAVDALFLFGDQLTVSTPLGTEIARRPGSAITIRPGQPPSSAQLVDPALLHKLLALLEGSEGGQRGFAVKAGTIDNGAGKLAGVTGNANQENNGNNTGNPQSTITLITDLSLRNPVPGTNGEGRFIRETPYTSFDPNTLDAPRDLANNAALTSAQLGSGTLTVTASNSETVTVPFDAGNPVLVTSANSSSTGGPLSGAGISTADMSFYAYSMVQTVDNIPVTLVGGRVTPPGNFPTTGFGQHTVVALNADAPFLPSGASGLAVTNAYNSPIYSAYSPVLNSTAATNSAQRAVWFQASLGISGTGAAQSSYMGIAVGSYFTDETKGGALYAAGTFQGLSRDSAQSLSKTYTANISTVDTGNATGIYGLNGESMALVPEQTQTQNGHTTRTPQAAADQTLGDTATPYYFVTAAIGGTQSATTANIRTAQTLNGYASGLVSTALGNNTYSVSVLANESPDKVSITTSPSTNQLAANFQLHDANNGVGGTSLNFGSLDPQSQPASAFIDDKLFAASQSTSASSVYNDTQSTSTINATISMVTSSAVENPLFAEAGVTPCTCAYLTWGYWQADLKYTSGSRAGQEDTVNVGTWVAGVLPDISEIPVGPNAGSASYTGMLIGNVQNGSSTYMAVGDYTQTWNFAQRSGAATVNNFDGMGYAATLGAAQSNPRDFFSVAGADTSNAGRSFTVNGSFFKGGGDPVAAVGGTFRIDGTNYMATGTFAASK